MDNKIIKSIRGAITIEHNTKADILENTQELLLEVIKQNNIEVDDIINIIFTATKDITDAYPAIATRNIGIVDCAIMCMQELNIENSLPMCIRVMFTVSSNQTNINKKPVHVYLKDARKLRPDLFNISSDKKIAIAIDGPAGTGKSTVSKIISKELNFMYLDTGALYRGIALYCIQNNIDYKSQEEIAESLGNIDIKVKFEVGNQELYLNNKNVNAEIRSEEVSKVTSEIAQYKVVRDKLIDLQRGTAKENNIIMDGRDIGTNILPSADVKIYLDADPHERASRRYKELLEKNVELEKDLDLEKIKQEIINRDNNDMNREIAPLKKAEDTVVIDTSDLKIEEVCDKIIRLIKDKI